MSVRERRNRKDTQAKTWDRLHAWRCRVCQQTITQAEIHSGRARRLPMAAPKPFSYVHVTCPGWPP